MEKDRSRRPLSDEELAYGIKTLTPTRDNLIALGPAFQHAWQAINNVIYKLTDYQSYRQTSRRA